jgi:hypothetical protein
LDNLNFYYHGVHYVPLWFEFFIHAIVLNLPMANHTQSSSVVEHHDETTTGRTETPPSTTEEIQMKFNKMKLFD